MPLYYKIDINNLKKYHSLRDRIWILKPAEGYKGEGIQILEDISSLKKKNLLGYKEWVIQEYINNPFLINSKKFHIRCLFLYTNEGKGYIFSKMPIYLATKDFIRGNYEETDVHITHLVDSQEPLYYPDDIDLDEKKINNIDKQIYKIFNDIMEITSVSCYNESKNCYEIFGADLFLTDKLEVKLLEINNKIGLKEFQKEKNSFNNQLIESEVISIIDTFFPPKVKQDKKSLFIALN